MRSLISALRPLHVSYYRPATFSRRWHSQGQKHTKGYQAMGSFHSDNVDLLMSQSDATYQPPSLPFETTSKTDSDFLIDRQRWTFLNHGAFGGALKVGYERAEQWRLHLEKQPLRYFDRDLLPHLVYSARRLADFTDAPREATTLIPNVTYGLNTVMRGYTRVFGKEQSHIVLWDTSYGSLKKIAHQLCDRVTEIPLSNYLDRAKTMERPNEIFEMALSDTLRNMNCQNALLVLDQTTSNTAINMPLHSLSTLGKDLGMLVLVDGAHGLLAQPVKLSNLPHVDFYLGNGHKWLSCPRGIGFLYCPHAEWRDTILAEPAVMSHGIGQGFQSRFLWDGCRDYAAALSVPAVLDYWLARGVDQIQAQLQTKLHAAVKLLGREWYGHADDVTLVPLELHAPMMALVRLPPGLQRSPATSDDAKRIQDYLFDHFMEVPIKCVNGILYVRISVHVYNEPEEYARLAKVVLDYPSK